MAAEGLYGPGSAGWRYNREATLLLGAGPRALLLQVAHPLVAEGVAQHSDFRADPWAPPGRDAPLVPADRVRDAGRGPGRGHAPQPAARPRHRPRHAIRRRGCRPRAPGTARCDPALSLWVHATLIDSLLVANDRWATALTPGERERFYAETRPVGRAFGVPEDLLPRDIDAFDAYVASMLAPDGPVHPSAIARELAPSILQPPLEGVVGGRVEALLGPARTAVRRVTRAPCRSRRSTRCCCRRSGCCRRGRARSTGFAGARPSGRSTPGS